MVIDTVWPLSIPGIAEKAMVMPLRTGDMVRAAAGVDSTVIGVTSVTVAQ